jgi:D-alanyl-D-alanine carboxypeptidase
MNRPPYFSNMSSRRREALARRRRLVRLQRTLLALALVVAIGAVTWATRRGGPHAGGSSHHAVAIAATPRSVAQLANGPVAADSATQPLTLRLSNPHDPVHIAFHHPPRSGLLFDLDTGQVLWRRQPERVLPIASLTKMMTALLVVEHTKPHDRALITSQAVHFQGSGVGLLPKGKHVAVEALLNGLLLPSGNDAAIALAQHVSGTQKAFIAAMNAKAQELGLSCTHYTSPSGFYDAGNHSCAVDLAALARADLDEPRLARIVRRRRAVEPFPIKGGKLYLYNNNPLFRLGYPGLTGLKTGYTDKAGICLVATATRHGRRLGVVLLHSPNTGDQAMKLLNRGFDLPR